MDGRMTYRRQADRCARRDAIALILSLALAAIPGSALAQTAPSRTPSQPSGGGGVDVDEAELALGVLKWAAKKKRESDARKKAEEAARKEEEARLAAERAAVATAPAPQPVAQAERPETPRVEPTPATSAAPAAASAAPVAAAPRPTASTPAATRPVARPAAPVKPPVAAPTPVAAAPVTAPAAVAPAIASPPVAAAPTPELPAAERIDPKPWPIALVWLAALLAVVVTAVFAARRVLGWGMKPPSLRAGIDPGDPDAPAFDTRDGPQLALHASRGALDPDIHFPEAAE